MITHEFYLFYLQFNFISDIALTIIFKLDFVRGLILFCERVITNHPQ